MTDLTAHVLRIIREECDWFGRYPQMPLLTADSVLDERWFGPVERVCVQMALDETFGIEIPSDEAEAWASVADVAASVARLIERQAA